MTIIVKGTITATETHHSGENHKLVSSGWSRSGPEMKFEPKNALAGQIVNITRERRLTITNVPGRNTIVMIAIVCIDAFSEIAC